MYNSDVRSGVECLQVATSAGVPVILDAGGMEGQIPPELLSFVDILSPNETELARLTGMPTESFEQICQAAGNCHKMVSLGRTILRVAKCANVFYILDCLLVYCCLINQFQLSHMLLCFSLKNLKIVQSKINVQICFIYFVRFNG